MDPQPRRVAVCALTYLRPLGLRRLLDALDELAVPSGHEVVVIIVDNDPSESARIEVEAAAGRSTHEVVYVPEPARGISSARNAAVATALSLGADQICFIDDDEWPDVKWLEAFLDTAAATGADIVTGIVFPVFDEPPPAWVEQGGFFDRRRHEHHERIGYATTSTVMISAATFTQRPAPHDTAPFDLAFGLSGGEDTHLFAELVDEGRTIVWSDDAHVFESIPPTKVSARWIIQREYRRGQTLSLSLRQRTPTTWRYVRRIGNGLQHIAKGLLGSLVGIRAGRAGIMRGASEIVFGAGMLTGLAGRRFAEYATTHGN